MTDSKINTAFLRIKIAAAAVLIPLALFTLNQFMLQTYNLAFPELSVRLKYAVQPTIYLLYMAAAIIIVIFINRQLRSLYRFLGSKGDEDRARKSTLKIPWILILVNSGLWIAAITLFYALQGFKSEGGVPYFWSLTTNSFSGCISAILAALVVNRILIPSKIRLQMTEMRRGEDDLFIKIKIPLVFITGFIYTVLTLIYAARFFTVTSARSLPQLPIGFGTAMVLSSALGGLPILLNMILSVSEDRIQRRLLLQKMRILTSGSGDLGTKVNLINFDEIGQLAAIINTFIEKIRTLIVKADNAGTQIVHTSSDIGDLLSELAETTTTMLNAINSMDNEMSDQEDEIGKAKSALEEYFNAQSDLSDNINSQSGSVEQTSKAAEYIAGSIKDEVRLVRDVEHQTGKLIGITANGSSHIADFIESIRNVERSSLLVEEILDQMKELSEQIDMLAMNAAIEAAHAGDAGKGFAVVAEEVRRLSDNNAEQSGEIANHMSSMMTSINDGNAKTKLADTAFREISKSVEDTAEKFQTIIQGTDNVENAVGELTTTMNHLLNITDSLKKIAAAQKTRNDDMKNHIEKVFGRFGGLKLSMDAQRKNRDVVSGNLDRMKTITEENLSVVQELNEILKQFTL